MTTPIKFGAIRYQLVTSVEKIVRSRIAAGGCRVLPSRP
jgi:hypothetical protein